RLGDGRVRVLDAQRGDARGGAQGDTDREAVLLALEVRILVIDPEGGEVAQLPRVAARLLALGLQQAGDGSGVGAARGDLPPCEQGALRERRAGLHAAHGRGGRLTGRGDAFCRARAGRGHGLHLLVGVLVHDAPRTRPTSRRGEAVPILPAGQLSNKVRNGLGTILWITPSGEEQCCGRPGKNPPGRYVPELSARRSRTHRCTRRCTSAGWRSSIPVPRAPSAAATAFDASLSGALRSTRWSIRAAARAMPTSAAARRRPCPRDRCARSTQYVSAASPRST